MNDVFTLSITYVRMKTERGDWWGDTIPRFRRYLWEFTASLPKPVAADVRRVKRHHVDTWLHAKPSHSPAYKRTRLVAVRGFFNWLHQEGKVGLNPAIGVSSGTIPDTAPRSYSDEEVDQLFQVARRDPRELVCVSLCWNEGTRRSEVSRALIQDLDFRTGTLKVRGKFRRGEVSRTAAVSPDTIAAIHAYLRAEPAPHGPLVRSRRATGGGMTPHGIGQIIDRVVKDAGLKWFPFDGRSSHAGRHTAATQAVEAGVPNETLMRHFGWESDATLRKYSKSAALDLHVIHELRAVRREALAKRRVPDEVA